MFQKTTDQTRPWHIFVLLPRLFPWLVTQLATLHPSPTRNSDTDSLYHNSNEGHLSIQFHWCNICDYRLWSYGLAALKFSVLQSSRFFDQVTICGSQVSTSICAEFHALGWNTSILWQWVWMAATVIQVQQSQFQRSGNSVHLETILPKLVVMHLKEYKAFHTPMCRIKCSQSFVLSFSQGAPKSVNMMTISTLKYVNLRLINLRNRHQC